MTGPNRPVPASRPTRRALLLSGLLASTGLLPHLARAAELVVGYLYVGARNDFGYNQSHALAARKVATLPGVRVVEQEKVPESTAVAAAMEAMIVQDGAKVLFPTSYGYYDPHVLDLARKYPDVYFRHCGGRWRPNDPPNIGSYFGHMHEGQFLAGFIAGHHVGDNELGFVASNRYPPIMRNLNAFFLGARQAAPDIRMRVVFTGSWSDPVREAEAVNVLADQGATVFGCSVDSARNVITTARRRGLLACGYNASMAEFGQESYLTAAVSRWENINVHTIRQVQNGEDPPNYFSGGLKEGIVNYDTPGPAVTPAVIQATAQLRERLIAHQQWIWSGPLTDNTDRLIVPAGERINRDNPALQQMDWFVQGVRA